MEKLTLDGRSLMSRSDTRAMGRFPGCFLGRLGGRRSISVGQIATYIAPTLTYAFHVRKQIEYDALPLPSFLNITISGFLLVNSTKEPLKPMNSHPGAFIMLLLLDV